MRWNPHHIGQLTRGAPRRSTGRGRRLTTIPLWRSAVAGFLGERRRSTGARDLVGVRLEALQAGDVERDSVRCRLVIELHERVRAPPVCIALDADNRPESGQPRADAVTWFDVAVAHSEDLRPARYGDHLQRLLGRSHISPPRIARSTIAIADLEKERNPLRDVFTKPVQARALGNLDRPS